MKIQGIVTSAEMEMCVGHFDSGFESNSEMVNAERRMSNHADQCNSMSVWRINFDFWELPVEHENEKREQFQFGIEARFVHRIFNTCLNFRIAGPRSIVRSCQLVDGKRRFDFLVARSVCLIRIHQQTLCVLLKVFDVRPVAVCLKNREKNASMMGKRWKTGQEISGM